MDKIYFKNLQSGLCDFTHECRPDMHEPDEQGITATVTGDHLDNAWGEEYRPGFMPNEPVRQEFVVTLHNENGDEFKINLASLIALARRA